MKKVSRANTYFFIIILLQLFLPVQLIFRWFNITDSKLMLLISHVIIFIFPAIIYLIITKQSIKNVLKLNKLYFKDALLIILLAFVCQPIMTFFSLISQFFFENEIGNFVTEIVASPYIILLLLIAVLPAITEEITIRGVVLSGYEDKNIYLAASITGLLFGIMHLDPQQFLYAAVLGFVLALVVRITNSIFASALIHFLINGTSITLQKLLSLIQDNALVMEQASEVSIRNLAISEKIFMAIFYGLIALAFGVAAYFIIRKLAELNIRRGIISRDELSIKYSKSNERVFNIQFIAIIIVYLLYMMAGIIIRYLL
ncbi:CPBP family intramembrane glutamic endopeptidase [Clostridium sp.]|uniref:CPBP family intramembrane glutamic endopeptidase n=1 Tax=Clostridium sp. TaxID=1506 RepID=UPI0025EC4DBD|nr:type II CAAX endopeptidase family protein [uncultured Clostridium sp.]MDU4885049.1 type II CAAX endopeptidase family protein [Clostridium celatum]MDU7078318.1 type II CAAX endopeptidase family protein [Clostridium celatum]